MSKKQSNYKVFSIGKSGFRISKKKTLKSQNLFWLTATFLLGKILIPKHLKCMYLGIAANRTKKKNFLGITADILDWKVKVDHIITDRGDNFSELSSVFSPALRSLVNVHMSLFTGKQ